MLLHERCTITLTEKVDKLNPKPARVHTIDDVPCEINALDSTKVGDGSVLVTRYRFFSTLNLVEVFDAKLAEWNAEMGATITITYRGKSIKTVAGIETHRVMGRFHHVEAIIEDLYSLGT